MVCGRPRPGVSCTAPTLLIVGGHDPDVFVLNQAVQRELRCDNRGEVVPGAAYLFEEPGALEALVALAKAWFLRYLVAESTEQHHGVHRQT